MPPSPPAGGVEAFRRELREWLEAHAPAALRGTWKGVFSGTWGGRRRDRTESADERAWREAMGSRGYTAPTWPTEYGGGGLDRARAQVLTEELRRLGMPAPLVGFGLVMVGPTLLEFGSEAQKQQHLPPIVRGEIRWCQGYSEPGAGSDLAGLRTSATLDGGDWVVTGHKVWTSYADLSDWIFCLARTNPQAKKQAGISFLLIDMDQPAIRTEPIRLISGASPFCEVFLDGARTPRDQVVGGVDAGWTVAKTLLQHERATLGQAFAGSVTGDEGDLVALARRAAGGGDGPLADGLHRDAIARIAMDERAFLLLARDMARSGRPGAESSALKVFGTELNQRRLELGVELAGPDALGWEGPGFDAADLARTRDWLRSRGNSIEGGTTEVQLGILARQVLGLP
ncbi:MAG: acyl-CoA dehydrogenase family protein [Deltaproteobacteria bacterium]|nr:acyl-CoA dehydrogenase family protein [Deltaproteobacteria bacterium]MCB9788346.1 acyl-CoA dehydrogenase family protein [Deltaproteobacteria bacterium]